MSRLQVIDLVKKLGSASSPEASAVLCGVTFSVSPGECLGLKGTTGAGKTTLLRIIAGLLRPDAGEVHLDEQVLSSPTVFVPPQARHIGLMFQTLGLWPHLTVRGHLEFVLSSGCLSRPDRKQRIEHVLHTFVLNGLENRYPAELSGGERHLLALARALSPELRLLLLDEPFSGLDGALKTRIIDTVRKERSRRKLTTLLVTHQDDEMRALCQRVEHLNEGCIVERVGSTHA